MTDSACYLAKDIGRNRVYVYRDVDKAIAQRTGEKQWVGKLGTALESNRFLLVRQRIEPLDAAMNTANYCCAWSVDLAPALLTCRGTLLFDCQH